MNRAERESTRGRMALPLKVFLSLLILFAAIYAGIFLFLVSTHTVSDWLLIGWGLIGLVALAALSILWFAR